MMDAAAAQKALEQLGYIVRRDGGACSVTGPGIAIAFVDEDAPAILTSLLDPVAHAERQLQASLDPVDLAAHIAWQLAKPGPAPAP